MTVFFIKEQRVDNDGYFYQGAKYTKEKNLQLATNIKDAKFYNTLKSALTRCNSLNKCFGRGYFVVSFLKESAT